ncbi:hypothetical protein K402DRAFT_233867 [Aulographum hederae CBS 113979]|uniref:Uncharacterized protein n=1 Tax=Aulographum hederae CBS 113979 TaxID=1176131 RepID=A0A6G1GL87_9PEZI|nr:hypothetical protein K402DRAFT_233867 [Aulographum hederae CBS 113979]
MSNPNQKIPEPIYKAPKTKAPVGGVANQPSQDEEKMNAPKPSAEEPTVPKPAYVASHVRFIEEAKAKKAMRDAEDAEWEPVEGEKKEAKGADWVEVENPEKEGEKGGEKEGEKEWEVL